MEYRDLLPLLPGMSLALPPGGSGQDLVLVRRLKRPLSPELQETLREELRRAERAVSPAILPLMEHAVDGNGMAVVYPWKDGLPLAAAVARAREAGTYATLAVGGRLVSEALGALATMHGLLDGEGAPAPLVHGSFRPDSLWLGFDGLLQLSDAGLCSLTSRLDPNAQRVVRADVMAAGVVAHVVMTGQMPQGATEAGFDPRTVNPAIPEPVALVIMQATHPVADLRFADAQEMKDAWDGALSILGGVGFPEQVNRWLSGLFPANHPLIGALKNMLTPLGAGAQLPTVAGPLLSSARLAPVKDKPANPSSGGMPAVSAPRLVPVVDASALPRPPVAAAMPVPQVSAPLPVITGPAPVVSAPLPVVTSPAPVTSASLPVVEVSGRLTPVAVQPAAGQVTTQPRMPSVPEPPTTQPAAAVMAPTEETTAPVNRPRKKTATRNKAVEEPADLPEPTADLAVAQPRKGGSGMWLGILGLLLGAGGMLVAFKMGQQQVVVAPPSTSATGEAAPDARPSEPQPPVPAPAPKPVAAAAQPAPAREPARAEKEKKAAPTRNTPRKAPRAAADTGGGGMDDGSKAVVHLDVTPWATIYVDGKRVGKTPMKPLRLSPGRHVVKFVNEEYRASRTETLDVQPGMEGTLTVQFTPP